MASSCPGWLPRVTFRSRGALSAGRCEPSRKGSPCRRSSCPGSGSSGRDPCPRDPVNGKDDVALLQARFVSRTARGHPRDECALGKRPGPALLVLRDCIAMRSRSFREQEQAQVRASVLLARARRKGSYSESPWRTFTESVSPCLWEAIAWRMSVWLLTAAPLTSRMMSPRRLPPFQRGFRVQRRPRGLLARTGGRGWR